LTSLVSELRINSIQDFHVLQPKAWVLDCLWWQRKYWLLLCQ